VTRGRALPWILLTLWAVWIYAFQAFFAAASWSAWVPDVALVLMLGLAARLPSADVPLVGLCVGVAGATVSVDPAASVLAAALGVVGMARGVRSVIEIKSPPVAGLLAFVATLCVRFWLAWVHETRIALELGVSAPPSPGLWAAAWPGALTTALVAMLFGGVLAHLPGLTPLRRRRPWRVGASFP
jgi:hypothetical protein